MAEAIPVLYLARHGSTVLNQNDCFRGNANPPLSEDGLRDANRLGAYFADIPLSFIISSDKLRATQTANIIGQNNKTKVHSTPNLRALNVGSFSGQPRNTENTEALQQYLDNPDLKIPGGESLNGFRARVVPAIWEAIEIADDSGLAGLLVCHSSLIHEASNMILHNHQACLVKPGGVAAIYIKDGKIGMNAIYRPFIPPPTKKTDTIS